MKKLTELEKEEKRILAAEACGYKFVQWSCRKLMGVSSASNGYLVQVPDYGNDLNACADMEKTLTEDQCDAFDEALGMFFLSDNRVEPSASWLWNCTAAQRLDAFLLAKGLAE